MDKLINDNLPADKQEIDNIPDIIETIGDMSKEELIELYENSCLKLEDVEAQISAIKDILMDTIKGNGEVIGEYAVTKAKRFNWKPTLEQATELGAVKPAIDTAACKRLYEKGVEIAHTITNYLLIKKIVKKEEA